MIALKYSETGAPFITLGKYGKLIFSELTCHPGKGYQYFAYTNLIKKEKHCSYVIDMHFKRNKSGTDGIPNGTIPRRIVGELIEIVDQFLIGQTYFPKENITYLGEALDSVDWTKLLKK